MELILDTAFKGMWWLLLLAIVIGLFKSPWFKGWLGESMVKLVARMRLPSDTYLPIHNVTLPTLDGTTQIDHIFVSRFGVFVIETKNMKGWIYGSERQPQWTQKIYRKSFKFQNPLHQNFKHVKALEQVLDMPSEAIHSVVVFNGDCTFKTDMPANITQGIGYISYIKSFTDPVLSEEVVQGIAAKVQSNRLEATWSTHRQHVTQLKSRNEVTTDRKCPKCGSAMVLRKAKKGPNVGNEFWGCSSFPQCKAVSGR